jgi:hypothetical protein
MKGACRAHGEITNAYKILVIKYEGNRALGRPRLTWGKIFKWFLREQSGNMWVGSVCFRIDTGGGLL